MDPINYTSAFAGLQSPNESFMQGVKDSAGIQQLQLQQQQAQLAQQQKLQMQADLQALSQNPTTQAIGQMSIKYPALSENFKRSFDMLAPAQQQAKLDHATQVYAALHNGEPKIAQKILTDQATALRNSGNEQDAKGAETMAALIEAHPEFAQTTAGLMISSAMGPDKFAAAFPAIGGEQRAQDQAPADLRKKVADAGGAEADAATKSTEVLGQTLGALANAKNVKPGQVVAAMKSLAAKGVIPKDQLDAYLSTIPENAAELPEYLSVYRMSGMAPKDQAKYTTPDANNVLDNKTSRDNTRDNNSTSLKVQDRIDSRANSGSGDEGLLPPETVGMMAEQYLAGDTSVMQNLGRGAQGAKNIIALRSEIARQAKAGGKGGADLAAQNAEYFGIKAGQRTVGTRTANVEMASNEAESLIPLAREASSAVARSGLLPFGKAQIMFDNQTNDPKLRQFAAANNALVNVYSRAISPSGVPTVADKEHAREMIATAMDHKSYMAVLDQMQKEITAARAAPQAVRKSFSNAVTGKEHGAPAPAIPAGWSVREH